MDISITYGGASSDCIAFEASDLYSCLQRRLMKEGLVLFGDNAYLNSSFLAMPYPNVRRGSCDDYNASAHERHHTQMVKYYGGLVHVMPLYTFIFLQCLISVYLEQEVLLVNFYC